MLAGPLAPGSCVHRPILCQGRRTQAASRAQSVFSKVKTLNPRAVTPLPSAGLTTPISAPDIGSVWAILTTFLAVIKGQMRICALVTNTPWGSQSRSGCGRAVLFPRARRCVGAGSLAAEMEVTAF